VAPAKSCFCARRWPYPYPAKPRYGSKRSGAVLCVDGSTRMSAIGSLVTEIKVDSSGQRCGPNCLSSGGSITFVTRACSYALHFRGSASSIVQYPALGISTSTASRRSSLRRAGLAWRNSRSRSDQGRRHRGRLSGSAATHQGPCWSSIQADENANLRV